MHPTPLRQPPTRTLARPSLPETALALGTLVGVGLVVFALGTGCGGRTLYHTDDAGANNANQNNNQNANTNQNNNQNNNNTTQGECRNPDDCVVAVKADACCACPEAASPEDLANDPCLVPEGEDWPDGCWADCPAIPCPQCPTQGRTADCQQNQCVLKEGRCTEDTQCVAAIRVDNCCQQAFPATWTDIDADPCLMAWPHWYEETPQACYDQWDPICDLVDCAPAPPQSRAMTCGSDGCAYTEECRNIIDCTLMIDHRGCCSCPEAWPASMVGHDPCVLPMGDTPPASCRPEYCDDVLCEPCMGSPGLGCQDNVCTSLWLGGR